MDRNDLLFRRACQQWHDRYGRCVKEANASDAGTLLEYVEQQLVAWKRHHAGARGGVMEAERALAEARKKEASARDRIRVLGHLHASMKQGERKLHAMIKAAAAKEAEEQQKHEMESAADEQERPGGDDGY